MINRKIEKIKKKIEEIKKELMGIERMRPGCLTRQISANGKNYYQISYTHKMKSKTEYVRKEFVERLRQEVKAYKKFKKLIQQWVDLAIERSKLEIENLKNEKN